MRFDGREFARKKKQALRAQVKYLDRKPVIVSVLVGENAESELYTRMKRKVGAEVGVEFRVERIADDGELSVDDLKKKIAEIGEDGSVDGVMVQLPLPARFRGQTEEILAAIPLVKDVDGLRWRESGKKPATARAVRSILEEIEKTEGGVWGGKFVVVGYTGNVGAPIYEDLRKRVEQIGGVNSKTEEPERIYVEADVIISCVGKPGIVGRGKYKDNLVVVDVGIEMVEGKARGDVDGQVYEMARVAVPVPGGVGPVTVVSLIENLVEMG